MDVLYILGAGSRWENNELRYSLRSLERFARGVGRVFVVGEDPGFLSDEVEFFRVLEAPGNKEYRIAAKILWAVENTGISEEFFFINDDHTLAQPVDIASYPNYHKGAIQMPNPPVTGYRDSIRATRNALLAEGISEPLFFDVHMPMRIIGSKWRELRPWWERSRNLQNGYITKSIYGNVHGIGDRQECRDRKFTSPVSDIAKGIEGRNCWSYGDTALPAVKPFLHEMFPWPCRWERKESTINCNRLNAVTMRYFFTEKAGHPIRVDGLTFRFDVVGRIAGTTKGVFATDDRDSIAILSGLAYVQEITEEEYRSALQKKNPTRVFPGSLSSRPSPIPASNPNPHVSLKTPVAEVAPAAGQSSGTELSEETAVQTGSVESPDGLAGDKPTTMTAEQVQATGLPDETGTETPKDKAEESDEEKQANEIREQLLAMGFKPHHAAKLPKLRQMLEEALEAEETIDA